MLEAAPQKVIENPARAQSQSIGCQFPERQISKSVCGHAFVVHHRIGYFSGKALFRAGKIRDNRYAPSPGNKLPGAPALGWQEPDSGNSGWMCLGRHMM